MRLGCGSGLLKERNAAKFLVPLFRQQPEMQKCLPDSFALFLRALVPWPSVLGHGFRVL